MFSLLRNKLQRSAIRKCSNCYRNVFSMVYIYNLLADDLKEDAEDDIEKVLQGKMTGAQFLIMVYDEKFIDFFYQN